MAAEGHVGELGGVRAVAGLSVGADRRGPRVGAAVQVVDRRLDAGVVADRQRHRHGHIGGAGVGDEPAGGHRRVPARHDGFAVGDGGQPLQGLFEDVGVVGDGARGGVARAQQQPQRFAAAVATIHERHDRRDPNPPL